MPNLDINHITLVGQSTRTQRRCASITLTKSTPTLPNNKMTPLVVQRPSRAVCSGSSADMRPRSSDGCCFRFIRFILRGRELAVKRETLLLGPRTRQRFGEAGDREIRRRGSIDDRRNDTGRNEGERSQQADVPFALSFTPGDLGESDIHDRGLVPRWPKSAFSAASISFRRARIAALSFFRSPYPKLFLMESKFTVSGEGCVMRGRDVKTKEVKSIHIIAGRTRVGEVWKHFSIMG